MSDAHRAALRRTLGKVPVDLYVVLANADRLIGGEKVLSWCWVSELRHVALDVVLVVTVAACGGVLERAGSDWDSAPALNSLQPTQPLSRQSSKQ